MASSGTRDVQWIVKNNTGRKISCFNTPYSSAIIGYLPIGNGQYSVNTVQDNFCYISGYGWVRTRNLTIVKDNTPKSSSAKKVTPKPVDNNTKNKNNSSNKSNKAKKASDTTPSSTNRKNTNSSSNKKKGNSGSKTDKKKQEEEEKKRKKKTTYAQYVNKEFGNVLTVGNTATALLRKNLNGIYGLPYQFPDFVDPKVNGNAAFGSIYADRIISRMPLLFLSPGKVDFMSNYMEQDQTAVLDALKNSNVMSSSTYDEFVSKPGKYYTFAYDEPEYWKYVNSMNNSCAVYLGIGDLDIDINNYHSKLSSFKWEKAHGNLFDSLLLSSQQYVCFYQDADPTRSESFSNSTTESQLASKVNSFSDIAKEVQFLVGTQTGKKLKWIEEEGIAEVQSKLNSMSKRWLNGSAVFDNITKEFAVIATGGKLMFPEIWADSEYSQSYDINLKFRCPNPNKLSWYLDICVPLNHLLPLVLPRTPMGKNIAGNDFDPSPNGYMSPFLVRAFSRGIFNCDMGIITNMSISKGKEASWSIDGLPSEVDVSIEIKDLYNLMAMTHPDNTVAFLQNNQYLNYMGNSCGISINKPDIERSIALYMMTKKNYYKNRLTGYNFWTKTKHGIQSKLQQMYSGIFTG